MQRRRMPRLPDWVPNTEDPIVITNPNNIIYENLEAQILSRVSNPTQKFKSLLTVYCCSRDINSIINLCRTHLVIEITSIPSEKKKCLHCQGEIDNDIEDRSIETCENCNIVSIVPGKKIDTSKDYDSGKTFDTVLDQFCCIPGKKMDLGEIRELIDGYFRSNSMLTCDKISSMPLNRKGQRGPYKIRIMYDALKQCKLSNYYTEIYYITHKLWRWDTPDDIIRKKETIRRHHAITQVVVRSIGDHMGMQLRLFKHILLVSSLYDEDDFIIPEAENSRESQETLWQEVCAVAQYRDPDIYLACQSSLSQIST